MQHITHSPTPYDPEVLRAWAEQAAYVIAAGDALWHYLDDHPTIPSTSEEH